MMKYREPPLGLFTGTPASMQDLMSAMDRNGAQ